MASTRQLVTALHYVATAVFAVVAVVADGWTLYVAAGICLLIALRRTFLPHLSSTAGEKKGRS